MARHDAFGAFFKAKRMAARMTLRSFCLENGFDPGNVSKMERGLLAPPEDREKLEIYAKALELNEGSSDWYELFDLAASVRGMVPADIQDDKALAAKLPVLFRTLRGGRLGKEDLQKLAERLRKA